MFFVTFGLFRADQKSAVEMDEEGRHGILISRKGEKEVNDVTAAMPNFQADLKLADPRIMDVVKEFPGEETVGMITIFPSVILQQQINSLTTRHIIPKGPSGFDFVWTHWCYADDPPEMRLRRTRQANLFGPAGFVSADDGEVDRDEPAGDRPRAAGVRPRHHGRTEIGDTDSHGDGNRHPRHVPLLAQGDGDLRQWMQNPSPSRRRRPKPSPFAYLECLDDLRLEEWPQFFTEECIYRVIPRENFEAGRTLCTIYAESRGMLIDRVTGLTRTQMYAPRYYRRSSPACASWGRRRVGVRLRSNILMVQTLVDKPKRDRAGRGSA